MIITGFGIALMLTITAFGIDYLKMIPILRKAEARNL